VFAFDETFARAVWSVLLGQHDGDHALGDGPVSCVWGMVGEALVVIIDLEKDRLTVGFERAEIVLFVRIVGVAEIQIGIINPDR